MNRKELEAQLDSILSESRYMAGQKDADEIWKQDVKAIEEVKDILHDYDRQAGEIQRMIEKYETPVHALRKGDDLYLCPSCNRRIQPRHNHCHWCGRMLRKRIRNKDINQYTGKRKEVGGNGKTTKAGGSKS